MQSEIRTAIYEMALTATGLEAKNLWWGKADEDAVLPFVVISSVANPVTRDTTPKQFEEFHLNFTAYAYELEDAETLEEAIMAVFDYGKDALTALLTNYRAVATLRMYRESRMHDEDRLWQNVVFYQIEVVKT